MLHEGEKFISTCVTAGCNFTIINIALQVCNTLATA